MLERRAAELFPAEAGKGHRHEQPVFAPELVVRESSKTRRDPTADRQGLR